MFKKVNDYNKDKFGGLFLLRNDGDSADVIFMYRSADDVLVGDTHYIKSADYSGYAHCLGRGCPACGKGIRVQTKLFIPMFNVTANEMQIWDRTMRFENQLQTDVFAKYPNPSEYVFRITRNGVANDVNTTYSIQAVGRNTMMSYDELCQKYNVSYPEAYSAICKELTESEMSSMLSNNNAGPSSSMPAYTPTPRVSYQGDSVQASQDKPAVPDLPNMDDEDCPFEFGSESKSEFEEVTEEDVNF